GRGTKDAGRSVPHALIVLCVLLTSRAFGSPGEPVVFTRDVLPILASKCFACHGPDPAERKAGLRFDDGTSFFAELPSGERAVVAGDVSASALVHRITATNSADRMPPPEFPKTLSPAEIDTLTRWV